VVLVGVWREFVEWCFQVASGLEMGKAFEECMDIFETRKAVG